MKTLKEKFQDYLKKKSVWGKISDVIVIVFIVAMFIPNSRIASGGFFNRIKSMVVEPDVQTENLQTVNFSSINWQLSDLEGNTVNFKSFEGKIIFINFWASWCPPCVGEMPQIQELYNKFKDNENVVFLLVSNEKLMQIKSFINNREYTFPVYSNQFNSPEIFAFKSIPATFVISKKGEIIIKETGAKNWGGNKMEQIINDLISACP